MKPMSEWAKARAIVRAVDGGCTCEYALWCENRGLEWSLDINKERYRDETGSYWMNYEMMERR